MRGLRNLLLLVGVVGAAGYFVYDSWIAELVSETPEHVWHLAGWSWVCWLAWHALQRLSR